MNGNGGEKMEDIRVTCPCCNKRLLDVEADMKGDNIIKIKCGVCKCLVAVSLHNQLGPLIICELHLFAFPYECGYFQ